MPAIGLFAKWSYFDDNWRIRRDKIVEFFNNICTIHPALEMFSPANGAGDLDKCLARPLIQDMGISNWKKLLTPVYANSIVEFWNRKKDDNQKLFITISFADRCPGVNTGIAMVNIQNIPRDILNGQALDKLFNEVISGFHPDCVIIEGWFPIKPKIASELLEEAQLEMAHKLDRANIDHQDEIKAIFGGHDRALWRLWLKSDIPWPGRDVRVFDSWQTQPPDEAVNLQKGKLYTWNRFAPWNLPSDDEWIRQDYNGH